MNEHRIHVRADAGPLMQQLAAWDADGTYVGGVHVGDVGWLLRGPDEGIRGLLHGWWNDDRLVAVAIVDETTARPRVAPDLLRNAATAEELADFLEGLPGNTLVSDVDHGSWLRQVLAVRGWQLDPDTWAALYADPGAGATVDGVEQASVDPDARVLVQRSGFERSTFDRPSWERMAALATYEPSLDLVLRDAEGRPVAAGTAWFAGEGGTAYVEPFAVHREHRRRGHGTTLSRALIAACIARGASGVSVCTPSANPGAVATYRAGGFSLVETLQPMVRPPR